MKKNNFTQSALRHELIHIVPSVEVWPYPYPSLPVQIIHAHVESYPACCVGIVIHPEKAGPELSGLDSVPHFANAKLPGEIHKKHLKV